jgi:3D-(3,5/4)-trihydroxycyclohexane-1,2-dione acylhydrolase (decyclizing)
LSTVRLTTTQAIVRFLAAQYSERDGTRRRLVPAMYGIFGHGNVAGFGQALAEQPEGALGFLQGRNEQSMVHAATGYTKATRRTATLACTSSIGPGSTNMVTGAALATVNRLPVLLFPSDVYGTRRQGPVLQQLEHPISADVSVNDAFRPVSRFFDRIWRPEQLLTALPEAMRVLTSPVEAGAATIALPQDIQSEAYDFPERFFDERVWVIGRPPPEDWAIERLADLVAAAERPLIVAGGGVIYSAAEEELARLAEAFAIPVAETFAGKGAVQREAWWALGGIGLEGNPACNEIARDADLVISVGTRLTDFATGSHSLFQHPGVRFAAINITDHDTRKQGAHPVLADAREALRALQGALESRTVADHGRLRSEVSERRDRWATEREEALEADHPDGMTQGKLIGLMQEAARPGDTIIAAAGGPPGDLLKVWDATGGRHAHIEFGFSCMGYEIPAAIGVRLAQPEGEVISFVGDGTFLLNPSEIVTAVQEGLKITVVVSENHGYQVIRRLQMLRAGKEFGNEFRARTDGGLEGDYLELDLAAMARGMGATAYQASTPEKVRQVLDQARAGAGPAVIVVGTVPHADLPPGGVWWDVAPAEVSEDEVTRKLRAEYEADRENLQRFYG